ncbi:MAG: DinB family protein [Acidobacteria bacterium]|nr:DinB family protein [Acidobacteriota bacterium]
MFRRIEDFIGAWETESGLTQKLLDALTDASLGRAVAEGHRTLGRIAWHLVTTIPEMMAKTGLRLEAVKADAPVPTTAAAIREAYAAAAAELLERVRAEWNDRTLTVEDEMYGEKWERGNSARVLVDHQAHHRGQMTVLMRQAGLRVPGVYGPAKEEWAAFGAPAPEV